MDMQSALRAVTNGENLQHEEMTAVMRTIMTGQATASQIGGFLIGLRMKGETVEEIAAAAQVMRELATVVHIGETPLLDTCGTGGDDGPPTFNISTTAAFVAAAAGAKVAKHGNRALSSLSGSADVLEAAGVNIHLSPENIQRCVREVGIGFMFAPDHHGATRHAAGPRREMGTRTIFNLLGPLTNPAGAPHQIIGVFAPQWMRPLAEVLAKLGSQHVLICHAEDHLDEISVGAPTRIVEMHAQNISEYVIHPEDFEMNRADLRSISVNSVQESLALMQQVLANEPGPALDIVSLNAGAAIYVSGLSKSLPNGIERAQALLGSGHPKRVFEALRDLSNTLASDCQ